MIIQNTYVFSNTRRNERKSRQVYFTLAENEQIEALLGSMEFSRWVRAKLAEEAAKQGKAFNNDLVQLKFDRFVAEDTKDSIRHAARDVIGGIQYVKIWNKNNGPLVINAEITKGRGK